MARKNRMTPPKAVHHLTARVANREFLLKDPDFKDWIVDTLYSTADFSGVELLGWTILDNHIHILAETGSVPAHLWDDPADEPDPSKFTLRPDLCTDPRWSPFEGDRPAQSGGDRPAQSARPRPPIGFHFSDEEMLGRLRSLYGDKGAAKISRKWTTMRKLGCDDKVEEDKERYSRRMYNISQFMKTFKERVTTYYNLKYNHTGTLWEGRFYSGIVEKDADVMQIVGAYIDLNACRAGIVKHAQDWHWNSYAQAVRGGKYSERCRKAYERIYGCAWEEARRRIEETFADKLPKRNDEKNAPRLRASQAIHAKVEVFSHGAFIGRGKLFVQEVIDALPPNFPHASGRSVDACCRYVWRSVAA